METYGPKLLGAAYKDPITSFNLFHKFSVEHPEVSTHYFGYYKTGLHPCFNFSLCIEVQAFVLSILTSIHQYQVYWSIVLKEIAVSFIEAPKCILDTSDKSKHGGTWLPGSVLNIAMCCLLPRDHPKKDDSSVAIVWRDEGFDDSKVNQMTLKELREQVMYALT